MKSLRDISLQITEPEYRKRPELSYSTLSTFQTLGFKDIDKLFDRKESPSLLFGSLVDTMITGTKEEFSSLYEVTELPPIPDNVLGITLNLYRDFKGKYSKVSDIPAEQLNTILMMNGFWSNPKYKLETRVRKFLEQGVDDYYMLQAKTDGKTIISKDLYNQALAAANSLKCSQATSHYFRDDNPFEPNIERLYQLKFAANLHGIGYRCMMDECIVLHDKKVIIPIDLKTSCSTCEEDFYLNFLRWHYQLQARLYYRILRDNLDRDEYFKDFEILDFRFIIINKDNIKPLIWEFSHTKSKGTLYFGRHQQIGLPDPEELGRELQLYLSSGQKPEELLVNDRNSLDKWINTL